jgi:protein-L-isoaspartate(D-aspartate) O-methyltransferase
MSEVPRELFVPLRRRRRAYADRALSIGQGQTISQPWIVAAICQALNLDGSERVLEIGTGSGYSAAVLSRLAAEVISIERVAMLAAGAERVLTELGVENVEVIVADGSVGDPSRAPFDAIAVHATAPAPPPSLFAQVTVGGRLVIPIASGEVDLLTVFERDAEGISHRIIGPCRFVPLIGDEAFDA